MRCWSRCGRPSGSRTCSSSPACCSRRSSSRAPRWSDAIDHVRRASAAISSAGYLFNDLRDVDHDRRHPKKRRPSDRQRRARAGAADRRRGRPRRGGCGDRGARRVASEVAGPGRAVRGDHRRLLARAQAPGDPRRDDDRLAVHPSGGRGSGGRRGARLGVAAPLYWDAGAVPRLHQAPPGGDRSQEAVAPQPEPDARAPARCSSTTRSRSSTR